MTDDFTHVMSYNKIAQQYLADILGEAVVEHIDNSTPCSWLPFLLGGEEDVQGENRVQTRVIKNYIFKIYTYDQTYSNGIIDRYHWITISQKKDVSAAPAPAPKEHQCKRRVASDSCRAEGSGTDVSGTDL